MDALSDVLRVVGLTGGIFLEAHFKAPWCIDASIGPEQCRPFMTPPEYVLCFHYVVAGECLVAIGNSAPLSLAAGDIVLLPHNGAHKLGSQIDIPAVDAGLIVAAPDGLGLKRIDYGGNGAE